MSLKAFHVLFVVATFLLCVGNGALLIGQYREAGGLVQLVVGAGSLLAAGGVVAYLVWFLRKLKGVKLHLMNSPRVNLRPMHCVFALGFVLLGSALPARACTVCQGNPDDPMTQGAASGVIVLALTVYAVLMGFASMALYWVVRSRRIYRTSAATHGDVATHPDTASRRDPNAKG